MVAVMLMDKTVTFSSAHDKARMKDRATLQQRRKVKLIPSQEFERLHAVARSDGGNHVDGWNPSRAAS